MKRILLILWIIHLPVSSLLSQNVNIPDPHFLSPLLAKVDTDRDGSISVAEAEAVTILDVVWKGISDMTGIEAFVNLETLMCSANSITHLDLSKNTKLKHLECWQNKLIELDVSHCTDLKHIECQINELSSLDVSALIQLEHISCEGNQISVLDLSNNTLLTELSCGGGNLIQNLDLSQHTLLKDIDVGGMPELHQICVWTMPFPPDGVLFDLIEYSSSPNAYCTAYCGADSIVAVSLRFLDALCAAGVDTNGDFEISYREAEAVTDMDVSGQYIPFMKGLEAFVNLQTLKCKDCALQRLNLSENKLLQVLECGDNSLDSLDVSNNTALLDLNCAENEISSLDVSNNPSLVELRCDQNTLRNTLDLTNNPDLVYLDCFRNYLKGLDLPSSSSLVHVDCYRNQLATLDLSNLSDLNYLKCERNRLTSLLLPDNAPLEYMDFHENYLEVLEVSGFPLLKELNCDANKLSSLKVTNNPALLKLSCSHNQISHIDISNNAMLEEIYCHDNQINSLDVSTESALKLLYCYNNVLGSLDLSKNQRLENLNCSENELSSLDLTSHSELKAMAIDCSKNQIARLDVSGLPELASLDCSMNQMKNLDLSENTKLYYLDCSDNQLEDLDISANPKLITLKCAKNLLSSLDVPGNIALQTLHCGYNPLTSLDLSYVTQHDPRSYPWGGSSYSISLVNMPGLNQVCIGNPSLSSSIDTTNSPQIVFSTQCGANPVDIPDPQFASALGEEGVNTNGDYIISYAEAKEITSLDVSGNEIADMTGIEAFVNLDSLNCESNQIQFLDLSQNTALRTLNCGLFNSFSHLDISHNKALEYLNIKILANLQQVCVWDSFPSGVEVIAAHSSRVSFTTECGNNIVPILDKAFLDALIEQGVDSNGDSLIGYLEAAVITKLDVADRGIQDMAGIETFIKLDTLNCSGNQISSLDVSNNPALIQLMCYDNQISALDLSNNTFLTGLWCFGNQLTMLNVSNNAALEVLWCYDNLLHSIDVSGNTALVALRCGANQITTLDLSNNTHLQYWLSGNLCLDDDCLGYGLHLVNMPSLGQVCVAEIPSSMHNTTESPNVFFTTECSSSTDADHHPDAGISIYPNPTRSLIFIETEQSSNYSVKITSLNGQSVYMEELFEPSFKIDLSSFRKGIYLLTIKSTDFIATRKIIKL